LIIGESLLGELRSHSQSDREAFSALHTELRRIAHAKMRSERRDHTLQPTALVNEAFIKIFKGNLTPEFWIDRSQAIRYIVHSMSQILNDHADAYRSTPPCTVISTESPFLEPCLPSNAALLFECQIE
jgi:hypothetical protein